VFLYRFTGDMPISRLMPRPARPPFFAPVFPQGGGCGVMRRWPQTQKAPVGTRRTVPRFIRFYARCNKLFSHLPSAFLSERNGAIKKHITF